MPRATASSKEWNHVYPLPSGRHGYGATTILNVLSKPALLNWAGKVNREAIYDFIAGEGGVQWVGSTLALRAATDKAHHLIAVKSAADIGSLAHSLCEAYVRHMIEGGQM